MEVTQLRPAPGPAGPEPEPGAPGALPLPIAEPPTPYEDVDDDDGIPSRRRLIDKAENNGKSLVGPHNQQLYTNQEIVVHSNSTLFSTLFLLTNLKSFDWNSIPK